MRIILILLGIGGAIAFNGWQEFQVSRNAGSAPLALDLAQVEKGTALKSNYVTLGPHWAIYGGSVYSYEAPKSGNQDATPTSKVHYAYYPVISDDHPFFRQLAQLTEQYGSEEAIPDAEWPEIGRISMLIKTKRFHQVRDIPDGWEQVVSLKGLVINEIEPLDAEEAALVKQSFPNADAASVLILEAGRQPTPVSASLGMMGGGGLLMAGAVGVGLFRRRRPS